MIECLSVVCRSMATLLEACAQVMKRYGEEPGPVQQRSEVQPEQSRLDIKSAEMVELCQEVFDGDESVNGEQRSKLERLNAPGQFYDVAKGTRVRLFQSWFAARFAAGKQVLNVPGSMQE